MQESESLLNSSSMREPTFNSTLDASIVANDLYEVAIENDDEFAAESHDQETMWLRQERQNNKSLHWFRRPSVNTMALFLFVIAIASASGASAIQAITLKLTCNRESSLTGKDCDSTQVQVVMSNLQMACTVSTNIATLITSGKVGALSDQYGRKIFLTLILGVIFIGGLAQLIIMIHWNELQFVPMVITEFVSASGGGVISLLTITNCYMTDIVEPTERIMALGMGTAALLVGLSVGPIIGNLVLEFASRAAATDVTNAIDNVSAKTISPHEFAPIKFQLILLGICLVYTVFIPESRSKRSILKSRTASFANFANESDYSRSYIGIITSQIYSIVKPLRMLYLPVDALNPALDRSKLKQYRIAVLAIAFSDALWTSLGTSIYEIFILYGFYKFNWDQHDVGILMATSYAAKAFVLIVFSPLYNHKLLQSKFKFKVLNHQFDMVDFSNLALAFSAEVVGLTMCYLSTSTLGMLIAMPFTAIGVLAMPTMASSLIKFYPESKVGEVFGASALLKNAMSLITPLAYLSIYKFSLKEWYMPGFTFLLSAGIQVFMLLGAFYIKNILSLSSKVSLESVAGEDDLPPYSAAHSEDDSSVGPNSV